MEQTLNKPHGEIMVVKQHIAELEEEREKLREDVREYRNIVDDMVEGMFRITPAGEILDINSAAAAILGYDSREDFFACVKKAEDIWGVPEDRARAHELLEKSGNLKDYVMEGRCKRGQTRWVTVNVRMVRGGNGDVLCHEGTFQDIHERKMLEDELKGSKKLIRTLLDLPLNHVVVLVDVDGKILECNQALPDRLGKKDMAEVIGKSLYDLLPPDAVAIRKEKVREIVRTQKPVHMEDMVNGRWYDSTAYPILGEDGNVTWIAAFSYDITDRVTAEAERDHILNNSFDLICIVGFDRYFKYLNPAWETMLGFSNEKLMSRSLFEIIYPEDHPKSIRQLEELAAGHPVLNFSCRLVCKDGSLRTFIWTATPVMGKDLFYCIGKDATAIIAAEESLRKSEARFRSYFELPLTGIVIMTPQKGWVEVNDRACEILGYSREELLGMSWDQVTHADDLPKDLENFTRVINGEQSNYSTEKRYRRKDGTYIWTMLSMAGVPKPAGGIDYIVALIQDIDERKKMEEELMLHRDHLGKLVAERTEEMNQEIIRRREKEEQYLALVESIVEWVWETDENFIHTYVSPRITELLGYAQEEFLGKTPYDFIPRNAVPALKKFVSHRKPFTLLQAPMLHKNGRTILVEASGKPYYDKDGIFKGYRGSCHDITEQKRTMDMLQENEKQLMAYAETLKETNAALRVLLKQRENDKREMEDVFVGNIKGMILPYVEKMKKEKMDFRHKAYLDIISTNLNELMAPFLNKIRQLNFTPKELEVASLIRDGKTTKEIAEIMGVATSAIDSHRNNIRTKLGLINKNINLRSYLMTFN